LTSGSLPSTRTSDALTTSTRVRNPRLAADHLACVRGSESVLNVGPVPLYEPTDSRGARARSFRGMIAQLTRGPAPSAAAQIPIPLRYGSVDPRWSILSDITGTSGAPASWRGEVRQAGPCSSCRPEDFARFCSRSSHLPASSADRGRLSRARDVWSAPAILLGRSGRRPCYPSATALTGFCGRAIGAVRAAARRDVRNGSLFFAKWIRIESGDRELPRRRRSGACQSSQRPSRPRRARSRLQARHRRVRIAHRRPQALAPGFRRVTFGESGRRSAVRRIQQ